MKSKPDRAPVTGETEKLGPPVGRGYPLQAKSARGRCDPEKNMWALGGEFIRDLHNDPSLRKKAVDRVLLQMIEYDGGPLLYHGDEDQQRSFDSTCRKFHRFLVGTDR